MAGLVIKLILIVETVLDKFMNLDNINALASFDPYVITGNGTSNDGSGQWAIDPAVGASGDLSNLLVDPLTANGGLLSQGGASLALGLGQIIENVVAMIAKISLLMPL